MMPLSVHCLNPARPSEHFQIFYKSQGAMLHSELLRPSGMSCTAMKRVVGSSRSLWSQPCRDLCDCIRAVCDSSIQAELSATPSSQISSHKSRSCDSQKTIYQELNSWFIRDQRLWNNGSDRGILRKGFRVHSPPRTHPLKQRGISVLIVLGLTFPATAHTSIDSLLLPGWILYLR